MLIGTAKPMPILPPFGPMIAVLMPMTSPLRLTSGAARVAGIDRGVGLDEILVALDVEPGAPERADDARGHGLAEAERIADGDHEIADLEILRIAERQRGEVLGFDLHQGHVGAGVAADQLRLEGAAVLERHHDLLPVLDHVVVGEHVALGGVHDHAGTGRHLLPLG